MRRLTRGNLYKSFTSKPYKSTTKDGSDVPLYEIINLLRQDINDIVDIAQWEYNSCDGLLSDVDNIITDTHISASRKKPNFIGRTLGLQLPDWFLQNRKSGKSRVNEIYSDVIVRHAKSELERIKAHDGTSNKYISSGWRRTANTSHSLIGKKISLSAADRNYAYITNNPFIDDYISLMMVIGGDWYNLSFYFDNERFSGGTRITLPDIVIDNNNNIRFYFTVEYSYIYKHITTDYIIGVDAGRSTYATVCVIDKNNNIVHSTTLSKRVHSLHNSINATAKQISALHKKLDKLYPWNNKYTQILKEIKNQRQKNIHKKRELAIISAQEIAYIAHQWDNAVVCFEDLSWIHNTMENGRWNRGELYKRTEEYVNLNGSRVIKVNCAYTSKTCYRCKKKIQFIDYHTVHCNICDITLDRDVNAAANIAYNGINTVSKISSTRKKSTKYTSHKGDTTLRTPVTYNTLSYKPKKVDRNKKHATGKCNNKKRGKQYKLRVREYRDTIQKEVSENNNGAVTHSDDVTVLTDDNLGVKDYQDSQKATRDIINKSHYLYDVLI